MTVFKCGPDFLDPQIDAVASGASVYNLDLGMCGSADAAWRLHAAALKSDLILIEGVMGLYDGAPSSADLARRFGLPVLAVLDAVRDESSKDAAVRLVFEPKTSKIGQQELITTLLAHTSLESSSPINMTMIGLDGRPTQKSLRQILTEWIAFRQITIEKRSQHRLDKVLARIANDRISFLPGPPTLFLTMLAHPRLQDFDISSLRVAVTGAATVPPVVMSAIRFDAMCPACGNQPPWSSVVGMLTAANTSFAGSRELASLRALA